MLQQANSLISLEKNGLGSDQEIGSETKLLIRFLFTFLVSLKIKQNKNIVLILEPQDSHSVAGQVALNKKQGVSGQSVSVSNNINIDKVSPDQAGEIKSTRFSGRERFPHKNPDQGGHRGQ